MDCWFLVISLIGSTLTTATTGAPGQLTNTGPMSHEQCVNSAKVLKAANPGWLVECVVTIPGGQQIQAF